MEIHRKRREIPQTKARIYFFLFIFAACKGATDILVRRKKRKSEMPIKTSAKLGSVYFKNTFFIAFYFFLFFLKANSCRIAMSWRAEKEEIEQLIHLDQSFPT